MKMKFFLNKCVNNVTCVEFDADSRKNKENVLKLKFGGDLAEKLLMGPLFWPISNSSHGRFQA
jgi:hypothetical protein